MSDANKDSGGDGGGGGAPPTEQLTREQVMAQRAEKKKLKEARKKGGGGGDKAPAGGGADSKAKGDAPEAPKAQKKPQQQQKQQQPQQKQPVSDSNKSQKQSQKPPNSKPTPGAAAAIPPATAPAPPPQKEKVAAAAPPKSTPKDKVEVPKEATQAPRASPSKDKSSAAAAEESKLGTPDRSIVAPAKPVEFQSTIQSLFKVKRGELAKTSNFQLHPLFHNLGVKLRNDVIRGTNHRCIALLNSIKDYVRIFETPSGMSFKHAFSDDLKTNMDVLRRKCPFAIGMNNAVEFLNVHLYKIEQDNTDTMQLKEEIMEVIDQYIEEKIEKAVEAIVFYGLEKIRSGDVLMIYSITEAVLHLLEKAAEDGSTFELIILHTPETILDIPVLLKRLSEPISKHTVRISTVNFSNAIYRMRHCTKIIIGGHGLFTTGGVMAQSGSGKLALLASTYNKPAIFLCETYKFCDRSPLDFFTLDEYMPELSITEDDLFEPKIKYDVTPAHLVTVVITDIDMLPSTSVPVVLRVQEGRVPRTAEEASETQ